MSPSRTVKSPDVRRDEIVAAARELFALQGVHATTFQHVAERVGVTRGLVYHYAGSMPELVDMVLEASVADFVEDLRAWDAARLEGDIDGALASYLRVFRAHLPGRDERDDPDAASSRHPVPPLSDAGLYVRYVDRSVEALIDVLEETTIPAYAARHRIEITHVRETFAMLIHGLIGLLRTRPEVSDQVLADLMRQTLRLAPNGPGAPPG